MRQLFTGSIVLERTIRNEKFPNKNSPEIFDLQFSSIFIYISITLDIATHTYVDDVAYADYLR